MDVRQLVACLVWRHVGVQGTQTVMLRPRNTDQWCDLVSTVLDVSVRAFCDSRKRLSDHINNAGSIAVTPTQGAAASERSTVHPCRPVDTVRASTIHTAAGWATATGLSCKERHFQWLTGPASLLHSGYQESLRESSGPNVNLAI
jgi:hypothetical protein